MLTKNQKELLDFLGPEYTTKTIDLEICLYRKINDHYDIEISGSARKSHPLSVFVWDISRGQGVAAKIVDRYFDISSREALKKLLDEIIHKYQNLI